MFERKGSQVADMLSGEGSGPHGFVCYAHKDREIVVQYIEWLNAHGFNLWYDDGLSGGSRWTDELANVIGSSNCVLYFISAHSMQSKYCLDEIQFAKDHDVPILPVKLDDVELTPGLRLMLGAIQILSAASGSRAEARKKIAAAMSRIVQQGASLERETSTREQPSSNRAWMIKALAGLLGLICGLVAFT